MTEIHKLSLHSYISPSVCPYDDFIPREQTQIRERLRVMCIYNVGTDGCRLLCVSLSFSEGDKVKITEANIRRKNLQSDRTGKDVRSEWEIIPF